MSGTRWLTDVLALYRTHPALHTRDCDWRGFEWIDANDGGSSVLSWIRRGEADETVAIVANYTPVVRPNYRIGVDIGGDWRELLNSDAHEYGGSGVGNFGGVTTNPIPAHGRPFSLVLTVPPLAVLFLESASSPP